MRPSHTLLAALLGLAAVLPAAARAADAAATGTERGDPFTTPIVPIPDPAPDGNGNPAVEPLPVLEMTVGQMQIVRLGEVPSTTITTFPGVVTVGIEPPDMLFIFAEAPGETQLIVADSNYGELFAKTILVTE